MTLAVNRDASAPAGLGVGVGLISAALLTCEIVLTRIFSVIVWYHFAFFAISVALFGLGAGALFVHLAQLRIARTRRALAVAALGVAISAVVVDLVLLNVAPGWLGMNVLGATPEFTLRLALVFALTSTPFICGGAALALAMSRHTRALSRLYAWDLVGAGISCAFVVVLLETLGAPAALLAAALLASLAALWFAGFGGRWPAGRRAALALLGAVTLLGASAPLTGLFEVRSGKGVTVSGIREFERWNSFSLVTVIAPTGLFVWGLSPRYQGPPALQKAIIIDLNALTPLTHFDGRFESVRVVSYDLTAFVYGLRPRARSVCVIGAGGGKDVLAALASGAERVTAVEINPIIVNDVVRGRYREFTGGLYDRPDVRAVVEDGRSFVRRSRARFDVIQLSMVDTSAATAAGAYALTENSLYTVDAFGELLGHLTPEGVFSVASVSLPDLSVGARLVSVARAALRRLRVDPKASIAVIALGRSGHHVLYDVLVKPSGFTETEVEVMARGADNLGFTPVYLPGRDPNVALADQRYIAEILLTDDDAALARRLQSWPVDVSPTTDDRPFFFYQNRLRDLGPALIAPGSSHVFGNGLIVLAKVALVAFALALLFFLVPLLVARRELLAGRGRLIYDVGYVACLGLGFMLIEIPLIQRLALVLGNPTWTLSVVLLGLLVLGGVGSRFIGRAGSGAVKRLRWAMLGLVACVFTLAVSSGVLLDLVRGLTPAGRAVAVFALVAPLGLLAGVALPVGLRSIAERAPSRVAWLWCVNSATSVVGSVSATLLSLHAGIQATLMTGGVFYALALLLSLRVTVPGVARAEAPVTRSARQ